MLMLSLRLAGRELRSGDLAPVVLALCLAIVATATSYAIGERLRSAVLGQAGEFLAADLVYQGADRPPPAWAQRAANLGLRSALTVEFASMIYAGEDRALLVSAKAVSEEYPLRGILESLPALTVAGAQAGAPLTDRAPVGDEIWLDQRLFDSLEVQPDEPLALADGDFTAARVLVREPDRASSMGALVPRAMIPMDRLASTDAVRPGSRVQWRFLLAGDSAALAEFGESLSEDERGRYSAISVYSRQNASNRGARNTLDYIRLAGNLVLLLALLGGLMAGRRYFRGQRARVALMKTLGVPGRRLLLLHLMILGWGSLLTVPPGLALGWAAQWWFGQLLDREFATSTAAPGAGVYALSVATAALGLLGALLPALIAAVRTPPQHLLRTPDRGSGGWLTVLVPAAVVPLVLLMSGGVEQALAVTAALVVALVLAAAVSLLLARVPGRYFRWLPLSLAMANWRRRRRANLLQIFVLSLVVFPGVTLYGFRAELFDEWDRVLERSLPNFFLNNLDSSERPGVERGLQALGAEISQFAPLIRGRWVRIVRADGTEVEGDWRRTVNLSWAEDLPEENELVAGQWWPELELEPGEFGLSLETDYADRQGVGVGDRMVLSIGGQELVFRVTSLREVNWVSMTPNFFALTPPGALDSLPAAWMASFRLDVDRTSELVSLLRQYPAVNLFELQALLEEARSVFERLGSTLNLLLALLLATGALVLVETLIFDLSERRRQGSLMRVFGAPGRVLVTALALELAAVGIVAGLVGAGASELLLRLLSDDSLSVSLSWLPFLAPGLLSALILLLLGLPLFRMLLRAPPAQILRGDFAT